MKCDFVREMSGIEMLDNIQMVRERERDGGEFDEGLSC